jgi:hypothetical protein
MALLDRVKERASPDLSDVELTAMIVAIVAEIDAGLGPAGPVTVELGDPSDPDTRFARTLRLQPPADTSQAITITERDPANSGDASTATILQAADYRILHDGRTLQRLNTGPNARDYWAPLVTAAYTPKGITQAARDEAVIKLMMIDLSYRGLIKAEKAGDYQWQGSLSSESYAAERANILEGLQQRSGLVLA